MFQTSTKIKILSGVVAIFLCSVTGYTQQLAPNSKQDTLALRTNVSVLKRLSKTLAEKARLQQLEVWEYVKKHNLQVGTHDKRGKYTWIHHIENGKPVYYSTRSNVSAGQSIKTNKLYSGGGLSVDLTGLNMEVSGTRSRLGMWEPGPIRATHQEFGSRAISRDGSTFTAQDGKTDHATHVGGSMIASGVSANARGMAYQAKLDTYDSNADVSEMTTAASEGMLVSNHSYGEDLDPTKVKNGYYGEEAKEIDAMMASAPYYLPIYAAGNDRDEGASKKYDLLTGASNAKNSIQVGAVKILGPSGYVDPSSVEISDFSSFGPTDDGRIKPDFVAPGVQIYSAYSADDANYNTIDGTSMASPIAASSLFLLQQHHKNTKAGAFMTSASLKALAIHTADETGASAGPDYKYGWGLLNMEKAIKVMNNDGNAHFFKEAVLANAGTYAKLVSTPGGQPFKVTIVWADKEGTPTVPAVLDDRTPKLVNDLDVRVVNNANSTTITELPWKLDPANPDSPASRGDNIVDNVEQIFVDNMPAGTYSIQVKHKGTLAASQAFSVVVSGLLSSALPVRLVSFNASAREKHVVLDWSIADAVAFSHFEIEKSGDTKTWSRAAEVIHQTGISDYQFLDFDILKYPGKTNYYRLKMVDLDGSYAYSRIRFVETDRINNQQFTYPNPFADKITIYPNMISGTMALIQLTDMNGKVVSESNMKIDKALGNMTVTGLGKLVPGAYILKIKSDSGTTSMKVLKQ